MELQKKSKKTDIIVGTFVLLIGIVLGGYLVLNSKTSQANLLEQIAQNIQNQQLTNDTDKDGLKNWEEEIHQTDPNNPDTDQDGYLDGEEVCSGYDPLKPSPDDKLPDNAVQQTRPEPGNLTQTLAYIISLQTKTDQIPLLNIDSAEDIAGTIVDEKISQALQKSSAGFLAEFIPDYQEEDILIAYGNDLAAIRKYAGESSQKIGKMDSCQEDINNRKDDSQIIQSAIETNNFEQINCLAKSYLQAYGQLLTVPVPADWIDIHQDFLSIFWKFHKVYQHLPSYGKDPLKGIIVLEKFEETHKEFVNVLEKMKTDLDNR